MSSTQIFDPWYQIVSPSTTQVIRTEVTQILNWPPLAATCLSLLDAGSR